MIPNECVRCKNHHVDEVTSLHICLVRWEPLDFAFKLLSDKTGKCRFKEEASEK